ncbi:YitT family protein [Miniphocaeibacter massiliensis]|uniref:YitT family protein n=1 Tax=Miniphocaeibacter massiliensis TaxID=2041841 RepID=UPI000C1BAF0C|nr:YitT family protein [Miniphocaeibacter massiliensis]
MNNTISENSFNLSKISKYFGNKHDIKLKIGSILIGDLICSFAMSFFFQQKELLSGGIGGVGLLLKFLFDIPTGVTILILNIPLVFLGYIFLSKIFTTYAMISAFVMSFYLVILDYIKNPFILEDPFLVAVVGGAVNGIGMGILFRHGTCQGGLDILAAIFKNKFNINIGNGLLAMNMVIVLFAAYIFGLDKGLYTIIAMVVGYNLLDKIQMGLGEKKQVFIISKESDKISKAIIKRIHRGVTFFNGEGAYTERHQKVIYTVVSTRQIALLKKITAEIDPSAFMSISDAYEVKGKGFITAEI